MTSQPNPFAASNASLLSSVLLDIGSFDIDNRLFGPDIVTVHGPSAWAETRVANTKLKEGGVRTGANASGRVTYFFGLRSLNLLQPLPVEINLHIVLDAKTSRCPFLPGADEPDCNATASASLTISSAAHQPQTVPFDVTANGDACVDHPDPETQEDLEERNMGAFEPATCGERIESNLRLRVQPIHADWMYAGFTVSIIKDVNTNADSVDMAASATAFTDPVIEFLNPQDAAEYQVLISEEMDPDTIVAPLPPPVDSLVTNGVFVEGEAPEEELEGWEETPSAEEIASWSSRNTSLLSITGSALIGNDSMHTQSQSTLSQCFEVAPERPHSFGGKLRLPAESSAADGTAALRLAFFGEPDCAGELTSFTANANPETTTMWQAVRAEAPSPVGAASARLSLQVERSEADAFEVLFDSVYTTVPEPSAGAATAAALVSLVWLRRRRRST